MRQFEYLVIGAGAVGCAIARELAALGRVFVVEELAGPGQVTSRFNSGVIHSGIHLPAEFLKAKFARNGSGRVVQFCRENGVDCRSVGMHIVITRHDLIRGTGELRRFARLLKRARQQRISISLRTGSSIRAAEPSVRCLLGIHIPGVHIIDQVGYVTALYRSALEQGVAFGFEQPVVGLEAADSGALVTTTTNKYRASVVINAAGLQANQVAQLAGYSYQQYFYRGEYYQINESARLRCNGLVYPVPPAGAKGLGIHLTPTTTGKLLLGPSAKKVEGSDCYDIDPTPPKAFYDAVSSFLPGLRLDDLAWTFSGIRPKLSDEPVENDFQICYETGAIPMINLIGIESPGLTASLEIASYIRSLIDPG